MSAQEHQVEVERALAFMNTHHPSPAGAWKITQVLSAQADGDSLRLSLVLCSGDMCAKEDFVVTGDEVRRLEPSW
ncbi:MAG: hypothetical protein MHM6MM_006428 [Cercozoa sp. M6MM]